MKINKIFHTLYFMVMFLPLFIIPIFAININQKEVDPISVTTGAWEYRNKFETNTLNPNLDNIQANNIYKIDLITENGYDNFLNFLDISDGFYVKYFYYIDSNYSIVYESESFDSVIFFEIIDNEIFISADDDAPYIRLMTDYLYIVSPNWQYAKNNLYNAQVFIEESDYLPIEYVYNEGHVYDNTDIGSQFLYSIYKPVNDYFNFKQYFGMNAVYDWFQLNFFNGSAPLPFFIFFNLMLYWLIISMLWLLFDVLIYVPLMIHRWLDKASIS